MTLETLEAYLREDPNNIVLLSETFQAALKQKDWARAAFYLEHAQSLQLQSEVWILREGDFWLAQQKWDQAQRVLEMLQAQLSSLPQVSPELIATVVHNLAYIDFQRHDYAACIARLSPLVETHHDVRSVHEALLHLWLRTLHRTYELDRAMAWARKQEAQGMLDPKTAGIASLIALDHADLDAARRWADLALADPQVRSQALEALITRASLGLADQDAKLIYELTDEAFKLHPNDGRSWSVRAFADMMQGDMKAAQEHFVIALQNMPEHIGTWYGLGLVQIFQNDLNSARTTFEKALGLDRNFSETHGGLALVLALQGHREEAQAHVERALRLDPVSVAGRYAQAVLNGEVGDTQTMRSLVKTLVASRKK